MSHADGEAGTVPVRPRQRLVTTLYELMVALPVLIWIVAHMIRTPHTLADPMLLMWAASIGCVDLMPVPASIDLKFSLSFPLQLAVALIYPMPVAGAVAFVGTSDIREVRREISINKALFNRAQIAASVAAESALFHRVASLHDPWYQLGLAVLGATLVGYLINVLVVAWDFHLESQKPALRILRQMHVGIFGEFVLAYMGLALFGVLVATSFTKVGIWSIAVFVAPLAFARQMFLRTHSLKQATEELEIKQQEQEWQALHDSLTGLPNRTLFMQRLHEAIDEAEPEGVQVAVMIMDLNDFKEINDTLGHHYGDLLLMEIGSRLQDVLREGDLIARLGGDEFGVVLPGLQDAAASVTIAERLLESLEQPIDLEGLAIDVTASLGIAIYPIHSQEVETLLRRADVAMYAAKETRGTYEMYAPSQDRYSPNRLTLISQIRPALENQEFSLYYQPKVGLGNGKVNGMEALIRWHHPERGLVQPDEFIPLAERTVLMRPLTMYVIDNVLAQWHRWARDGIDFSMAVNLSARNLLDVQLPEQVGELLDRWGVPPDRLVLELTESSLMADSVRSIGVLTRLSRVGVKISVDDFGTGYSSLSHLKRLPINEIKVDRSFVTNMRNDPNDALIVRATVDLGRNLGLQVVAEGVEDRETLEQLAEIGCDLAQGYYLSRPLPHTEVPAWLLEHDLEWRRQPVRRRLELVSVAEPAEDDQLKAL
jgi:diguanylate cyclase (GGDEF)-like protein